jgi:hypothetical protein
VNQNKKSKSFNISNFFTIELVTLSPSITRLLKCKGSVVSVHSWSMIFSLPVIILSN